MKWFCLPCRAPGSVRRARRALHTRFRSACASTQRTTPPSGVPLRCHSGQCTAQNVFIFAIFGMSQKGRPDIRYPTVSDSQYYFGMMADGTDMVRSLRRTGLPNPEEYRKAKNKYKTWDGPAITEYKRLLAVNARNPLVASKNQVEHARYYHLTELKSRREPEFVVVVSIFMSC